MKSAPARQADALLLRRHTRDRGRPSAAAPSDIHRKLAAPHPVVYRRVALDLTERDTSTGRYFETTRAEGHVRAGADQPAFTTGQAARLFARIDVRKECETADM